MSNTRLIARLSCVAFKGDQKMLRVCWALAAACALGGCDKMTAALEPAQDRINKAFPVADEVVLAMNKLVASTAEDEKASRESKEQYERLLQVRALTCTASSPIGRFDALADIRKKIADSSCFKEQDARLADWVGLRRVSVLLNKPPLHPLTELRTRQTLPASADRGVGVITSAESNVALLKSSRGTFHAVRLPDGKPIQTLAVAEAGHTGFALSPNGRIFAAPHGGGQNLKFLDVETGATLWSTDKYVGLVTWLPALNALILAQSSQGREIVIVDAVNGKAAAYPLAEKRPTWALALPDGANRRLVGGSSSAAVMDHTREPDGTLTARQLDFWRLARSTSSSPFLMNNGKKAFYLDAKNLSWIDLASGEQGFWETSPLHVVHGHAKLSESQVLVSSSVPGSYTAQGKVIDVQQATIAPVRDYQQGDGVLLPLTPRSGYLRHGAVTTIGGEVELGTAEDLQKAIASAQLEAQLAKLKTDSPAQGLPSADAVPPTATALLTQVPQSAQVAVVGVYEGKSRMPTRPGALRSSSVVRIQVLPASTPVVLVLSSYEPVRWVVQNGGRKISAVLLSGYYESEAIGAGDAPVLKIGSTYAYTMEGQGYAKLKKDIARYVSNPVRSFQGSYAGQDFSVSGL